jgi:hypothetical protein
MYRVVPLINQPQPPARRAYLFFGTAGRDGLEDSLCPSDISPLQGGEELRVARLEGVFAPNDQYALARQEAAA